MTNVFGEHGQTSFFAYPSYDDQITSTIKRAVLLANDERAIIQPWPQLDIFGTFIPSVVRQAIEGSSSLFADVTHPNPNVYYELGYAIGLGKPVGPVINTSYAQVERQVQKLGVFDNVGYRKYDNSEELSSLLSRTPKRPILEEFKRDIDFRQPLYVLDSYKKTDFRNTIFAALRDARVFFRSFDPYETPRLSTPTLIGEVTASGGIIIPLLAGTQVHSTPHNLRAAFTAGLAQALGRDVLLLKFKSGDEEVDPADFRDEIRVVGDFKSLLDIVDDFARNAVVSAQAIEPLPLSKKSPALRSITLGRSAAENEFRSLGQYFVETSEFARTVRGEVNVLTGRKGSGKSAIFYRCGQVMRGRRDHWVIDVAPESHQLLQFRAELAEAVGAGAAEHTLAAFWYYVLVAEVLISMRNLAETRFKYDSSAFKLVRDADEALGDFQFLREGDFTTRLSRLAKHIIREIKTTPDSPRDSISRFTNVIYSTAIPSIRRVLLEHLDLDSKICLLFDNIDKGWPASGVEQLDVKIVRTLLDALNKIRHDLARDNREFQFTVFLRNDIFELLMNETSDRGKSGRVSIDWTDREKLKLVVHKRLQAAVGGKEDEFSKVWEAFFPKQVEGTGSFDYFLDHSLMRPRFLISTVELAIANAINRGHNCVEEGDCVEAVRQHGYSLIDDFGFEIRDVSGISEELLYAFVGAPPKLSKDAIFILLSAAGVDNDSLQQALDLLVWYGGLGVELDSQRVTYIYDVEYKTKRIEAEMRRPEATGAFVINPALYVALQ